ncbi:uncharacterized protein LOC127748427 [Arachis duranensis]|uniref:Uncharacterized protein LOC127748427 n=1 Tax=Arachis duranensis TaxID=130453 RepID=A0A9C6U0B0_ARADU|nr:uncharacterized protein LOC127748427 [Arachis duranensis]
MAASSASLGAAPGFEFSMRNIEPMLLRHLPPMATTTTAPHCLYQLGGTAAAESTRMQTAIFCKKKSSKTAFEETKQGFVDYDRGQHDVSDRLSGLRKGISLTSLEYYSFLASLNRFQFCRA